MKNPSRFIWADIGRRITIGILLISCAVSRNIFAEATRLSAKSEFMRQTGHPKGWPGHIVDYVIPLESGGADSPSNMQWRTVVLDSAAWFKSFDEPQTANDNSKQDNPTEPINTSTGEFISRLNTLDQEILAGLTELKSHTTELAETNKKIDLLTARSDRAYAECYNKSLTKALSDKACEQADSINEQIRKQREKYSSKFPALQYAYDAYAKGTVSTDPIIIRKALDTAIKNIREVSAELCFPNGSKFNSDRAACRKLRDSHNYWGSKDGRLYELKLSDDWARLFESIQFWSPIVSS